LVAKETGEDQIKLDPITGKRMVPHWLSQPYFRPPPPPPPVNKRLKQDIKEYLESRVDAKRVDATTS
jgi:tRNA-dihydrouridine synthase 1